MVLVIEVYIIVLRLMDEQKRSGSFGRRSSYELISPG